MYQNFIKTIFFKLQVHILINVIFLMKLNRQFRKHNVACEPIDSWLF